MAGRETRTPLFSFDTPFRDRSSTGDVRNSIARDIVRNILESGTPTTTTTTTTTAATELTLPSITTSTTVFMPNTTQVQSHSMAMSSSCRTSMNEVSW